MVKGRKGELTGTLNRRAKVGRRLEEEINPGTRGAQ